MAAKTPVSVLQETCQKHSAVPIYELFVNGDEGPDNTRIFKYKVSALNMHVHGEGTSKQLAKHDGAIKLLAKLKDWKNVEVCDDLSLPSRKASEADFVSTLTNKCIVNNWPIPRFDFIDRTGPPHNPEFTMRCTVSKHTADGSCNTKKGAQKKAARAVLILIEEYEKANIPPVKEIIFPTCEEVIYQYRKSTKKTQRKRDGKNPLLIDRHRYFETFPKDKISDAEKILCGMNDYEDLTAHEKVHLVLTHFGIRYQVTEIRSKGKLFKVFELVGGDYDCVFSELNEVPWGDIVNYLKLMLNIQSV